MGEISRGWGLTRGPDAAMSPMGQAALVMGGDFPTCRAQVTSLYSLPSWIRRSRGFGLFCLKHEETSGSSSGDVCRGERVT